MARQPADDLVDRQVEATVAAIRSSLGDNAQAIYLYGSAVAGGLKPTSDLDLFVVLDRPTTAENRAALVAALTPLSAKHERRAGWRPLELTAAVRSTLDPLSDPPVTDFQFGEWLRDRLDAGQTAPEEPNNPDLTLLVEMVRQSGRPLHGPPPEELIGEVPHDRLQSALRDVIPGLLRDLDSDTANVLLTLARVGYTLATGSFASKDEAAEWVLPRVSAEAKTAIERARAVYLGEEADSWETERAAVTRASDELMSLIGA